MLTLCKSLDILFTEGYRQPPGTRQLGHCRSVLAAHWLTETMIEVRNMQLEGGITLAWSTQAPQEVEQAERVGPA
ncbi:hypothetical protein KSD_27750 [Ktedonobacter sp. SOSP1-85]|nr:hypothetical protein KSD_27750 [Ktedonobacter sp. SOSP1-85]